MNKTWIILKREYLNIVTRRIFLITTFVVPLGFALLFGVEILATIMVEEENYTVLVPAKDTPIFDKILSSSESLSFKAVDQNLEDLKEQVMQNKNEIVLELPGELGVSGSKPVITLYGSRNISLGVTERIKKKVSKAIRTYKLEQAGIAASQLKEVEFDLSVQTYKLKDGDIEQTNVILASVIGYIIGIMIYMMVAIYGSILLQGVIEEKTNRIVEIIISSVRPFQLLLGKTVALALVGLTQFLIWIVSVGALLFLVSMVTAFTIDPSQISAPPTGTAGAPDPSQVEQIIAEIQNFNWGILIYFPFYFLGGFFLYGSLFAAAGSAVDNIQDAQQFTLPITLPMIIPLAMMFNVIQNPNSAYAVFASIFPFFSPFSMMVRMSCTDVPWYEVLASISLLILTFLGCVWVGAKIYRTGILMYGKKPTFREIFRWVRHR